MQLKGAAMLWQKTAKQPVSVDAPRRVIFRQGTARWGLARLVRMLARTWQRTG